MEAQAKGYRFGMERLNYWLILIDLNCVLFSIVVRKKAPYSRSFLYPGFSIEIEWILVRCETWTRKISVALLASLLTQKAPWFLDCSGFGRHFVTNFENLPYFQV